MRECIYCRGVAFRIGVCICVYQGGVYIAGVSYCRGVVLRGCIYCGCVYTVWQREGSDEVGVLYVLIYWCIGICVCITGVYICVIEVNMQ